ncbi:hypothetical protein IE53DRAFT_388083 [Violaceomyces palustris]|uniref:Uncharacterized protein n=1 Tax=Violaceomyces palustris TaxID=1673888 RepID=A0ACD0NV14_9BASI|nr:hypothetical protein IE53DRAFT_388083 [Violaceomyces palustris]
MKASKSQFGKFKSWGSGIGSKLASAPSLDQASRQDLTGEIEQRGQGNSDLYSATQAYWNYLGKKKPIPFDLSSSDQQHTSLASDGKVLPIEAMGLAMLSYANHLGAQSSAYPACLNLLGEAHLKLGSLQASFAKDTSNIFLARIARSKIAIDSFHAAIKKLDAATARLEAAKAKVQKSKKEKRELEEELRLATAMYDEAVTDVEARAEAIQESEQDDHDCLSTYMQAHLDYLSESHAILEQARLSWVEYSGGGNSDVRRQSTSNSPALPGRPRSTSIPKPRPPPPLPRRASAKEVTEVNRATVASSLTSRSSTSLATIEGGRTLRRSSMNEDPDTAAAAGTGSISKSGNDKERPKRLRMPSFTAATDSVTSVAAGIGSSLGRTKAATSLFSSKTKDGADPSPSATGPSAEKERKERESGIGGASSSRWGGFMGRSKREPGFLEMDASGEAPDSTLSTNFSGNHGDSARYENGSGGAGAFGTESLRETIVNGVGLGESSTTGSYLREKEKRRTMDLSDEAGSPIFRTTSPNGDQHHHHHDVVDVVSFGGDPGYLGSPSSFGLEAHHTGASVLSDGDPFGGGGLVSPQATGPNSFLHHHHHHHHPSRSASGGSGLKTDTEGEEEDEDDFETSALTAGFEAADSNYNATGFDNGLLNPNPAHPPSGNHHPTSSSTETSKSRGPPPPVPSSSTFLSKLKTKVPAPPPLPQR